MKKKEVNEKAQIFSNYIRIINYNNRPSSSKRLSYEKYVNKLFSIFDIHLGYEAKGWLSESNSSFLKYFNDLTITEDHLKNCYDFFKTDIKCDIKNLQFELAKHIEWFKYVDILTSDPDIFFRSLIIQFLYIVKPSITGDTVLKESIYSFTVDDTSENFPEAQTNAIRLMKEVFFYGIIKYNIAYYMNQIVSLINSTYYHHPLETDTIFVTPPIAYEETYCYDYDGPNPFRGPSEDGYIKYKDINFNFHKDIKDFFAYIHFKIMNTFTPYQYEETFLKIDEFCFALKSFHDSFSMIKGKLDEDFYSAYCNKEDIKLYSSQLQEKIDDINNNINQLESKKGEDISIQKEDLEKLLEDLKNKLSRYYFMKTQTDNLSLVLSHHNNICLSFEKISGGIPILFKRKNDKNNQSV